MHLALDGREHGRRRLGGPQPVEDVHGVVYRRRLEQLEDVAVLLQLLFQQLDAGRSIDALCVMFGADGTLRTAAIALRVRDISMRYGSVLILL